MSEPLPSEGCEHRPVVRRSTGVAYRRHHLVCGECGLLLWWTLLEELGVKTDDWRELPDITERGGTVNEITWTCHVCKEERPDDKISVHSRKTMRGGVEFQENVRYCNDRPECAEGAQAYSHLGGSRG